MKSFLMAVVLFFVVSSCAQAQCSNGQCNFTPVRDVANFVVHNRYGEVRRPVRNTARFFVNHKPVRRFVRPVFVNRCGKVRRPVRNTVRFLLCR